jgi:hypothetical protein
MVVGCPDLQERVTKNEQILFFAAEKGFVVQLRLILYPSLLPVARSSKLAYGKIMIRTLLPSLRLVNMRNLCTVNENENFLGKMNYQGYFMSSQS